MWRVLLALCLWPGLAGAGALTVDDDGQRTLTLERPAQRIVSLAPHLTELLFDIGAGARVVGTVNYSNYPAAARAVPLIGDNGRLDFERILALRPDLVVAWGGGNPPADIARLRQLGLAVFVVAPHRLDDVARHAELLGRLTGLASSADAVAKAYQQELAALRTGYAGRTPVSVFYQVWHTPLMTVGGDQIISEALAVCGGRNIFAELSTLAPTVAVEAVLARDPQVIIAASEQPVATVLGHWRRWPQLSAVRTGQLLSMSGDELARATPQILRGVRRLCVALERVRAVYAGAAKNDKAGTAGR